MTSVVRQYFRPAESWAAWETVLRVLFGLALSAEDMALLERCPGASRHSPVRSPRHGCCAAGDQGKCRMLALIAVMLACFKDYSRHVSAGERVVIMVLAVDRDQAGVIFGYARALITETPMLRSLLEHETAESLDSRTASGSRCTPPAARRCAAGQWLRPCAMRLPSGSR